MNTDAVASVENWHGTHAGYVRHRCRCDECREYNNARARDYYARTYGVSQPKRPPLTGDAKARAAALRKQRVTAGLPDPNDPRHGTLNGYKSYKCRCNRCCAANRGYVRRRRQVKRTKAEQSC